MSKREGSIRVNRYTVGVWEEGVEEEAMRAEVMNPAIRFLRARGWKVTKDPEVEQHYKILSKLCRLGAKDGIEVRIRLGGRHLAFEFCAHGRSYKLGGEAIAGLPYLTVKRLDLERLRLVEFLADLQAYVVDLADYPEDLSAAGRVLVERARCWHTDPALGRARYTNGDHARRSADGHLLEDGQTAWVFDRGGRHLLRGTAHYGLNNMWWVDLGARALDNRGSFEIYAKRPHPPMVPREREETRRSSIQRALAKAVHALDFGRAEKLRRALFPPETPLVRVRSKMDGLYWRPNSAGYTNDVASAGLYPAHEFAARGDEVTIEPAGAMA